MQGTICFCSTIMPVTLKTVNFIMDQKIPAGTEVAEGTVVNVVVSMGAEPMEDEPILMEDFVTEPVDLSYVESELRALGMIVKVEHAFNEEVEKDFIIKTEPAAGAELTVGQTITIWVSDGPEIITAKMIDVVGMQYNDARQSLMDAGFKTVTYKPAESNVEKGEVIEQPYEKGTDVDVTETIELTISSGPAATEPPTEAPTEKPTEAKPETIPLVYTFVLPVDRTEDYILSLRDANGGVMEGYDEIPVTGGTSSIQVELIGSGKVTYQLYINGEYYKTETVEFTVNG